MRQFLAAVLAVAGVCWLLGKPWQRVAGEPTSPQARFVCSLKNEKIDESSGIAPSRLRSGVYWTHNDSGGKARVYAFDLEGNDLGTYTLAGVKARDWEDIASAKIGGNAYLYVGDIGDNLKDQSSIRVYRLTEPEASSPETIQEFETYRIKYPDGPHNCEALMVAPNGDLYLVTKDDFGDSSVYRLASPASSGTFTLSKVGNLKVKGGNVYTHTITAGDISADGKLVVLRTYFSILLFRPTDLTKFARLEPQSLPVPLERQGEAICFDPSGRRLITTSEGKPCRVSEVTLP